MWKYKLAFVAVFIVIAYLFVKNSEEFTEVKSNFIEKENELLFNKVGDLGCGPRDCDCKNCKWFNYKKVNKDPENISKLYMKNNGNVLTTDNGAIIWESDYSPAEIYGDKFEKAPCQNLEYFQGLTCWKRKRNDK